MLLPGRLRHTTLGDLLGQMYREGVSGVLELLEEHGPRAGRAHRITLQGGMVQDVDTSLCGERLGELMQREGLVGRQAVEAAARRQGANPRKRLGEVLIQDGWATPELVRAALRRQVRRRLESLFDLSDAALRFRAFVRGGSKATPLSPREVLWGRRRARPRVTETRAPNEAKASPVQAPQARSLQVLGLEPGATPEDVRRAFRLLARQLHPDRHPHADAATKGALIQRFSEVSQAYHALSA